MCNTLQITYLFSLVLTVNQLHFNEADSQILNGATCKLKNHPYYISLVIAIIHGDGTSRMLRCGGSLIKESEVLTAAHCCQPNSTFRACGIWDGNFPVQERISKRFKIHPKYESGDPSKYDLCVIQLDAGFDMMGIKLVELATSVTFQPLEEGDKHVDLMGYGTTFSLCNYTLHCTHNVVLGSDDCLEHYKSMGKEELFIPLSTFCTRPDDAQGSCHGDVGGPILYDGIQIGVVPLVTSTTCDPRKVTVFTRLDSELDFITEGFENSADRILVSSMLYTVVFFMNVY